MFVRRSVFALAAVSLLAGFAACGDDGPDDPDNKTECKDGEELVDGKCVENPNPPGPDVDGVDAKAFCEIDENKDKAECKYPADQGQTERDGAEYAYISGLSIPKATECCVDFTGQNPGKYNNKLASLLEQLGPTIKNLAGDFDLDQILTDIFADGSLTLIVAGERFPEDNLNSASPAAFDMKVYLGELDKDGGDWMAGEGDFTISGAPLVQSPGFMRRGDLTVQAPEFPLNIPGDAFGDSASDILGDGLKLNVSFVELKVAIQDTDAGLTTKVDGKTPFQTDKGEPINYLSGLLSGPGLADLINDIVGNMCGADGDKIIVIKDEQDPNADPGNPIIEFHAEAIKKEDETCDMIKGLEDVLAGILPILLDLDSNGNGVKDSLSLGLNLELSTVGSVTVE